MTKWIQKAVKNKGALRRQLKVKKGKRITVKQLNKLAKKKGISTKTKRRIALAKTLKKMRKKKRR